MQVKDINNIHDRIVWCVVVNNVNDAGKSKKLFRPPLYRSQYNVMLNTAAP